MIYKVIKSAISEELADFVYGYFLMKRRAVQYRFDQKYISGNISVPNPENPRK